jgi:hypothetical protein
LWTRRFFFFLSATTAAAAFSSFTIFSHSRMVRYWLLFFLAIYTQEDTDTRTAKNARTAVPIEEKWKKVGCKSVRPSIRPLVGETRFLLLLICCVSIETAATAVRELGEG